MISTLFSDNNYYYSNFTGSSNPPIVEIGVKCHVLILYLISGTFVINFNQSAWRAMKKEFIVYEGTEFTIEWYFNNRGNSNAFDYFNELTEDEREKLFYLVQILADTGKIANKEKFNYEGDQIFAFKPTPNRFICFFFERSKVIITNAYKKQSQKMPPREKERALKAKDDYTKRYKAGEYYD